MWVAWIEIASVRNENGNMGWDFSQGRTLDRRRHMGGDYAICMAPGLVDLAVARRPMVLGGVRCCCRRWPHHSVALRDRIRMRCQGWVEGDAPHLRAQLIHLVLDVDDRGTLELQGGLDRLQSRLGDPPVVDGLG